MRSNLRIHKLLNPALIHPHGVFDMINVLFRNARHHVQIFISTIRPLPPPSFMVSCNAASKTNGCSSHFSTLFSYYPPTHTRNSFCPRTSVRQSVSEHRMCQLSGRKARSKLSSLLSRRSNMHQGVSGWQTCDCAPNHSLHQSPRDISRTRHHTFSECGNPLACMRANLARRTQDRKSPAGQIGAAELARDDMGTAEIGRDTCVVHRPKTEV